MAGAHATERVEFAGLLEVLGHRWALRLIWELRDGGLHFTELRNRAGGLSQSVLVTRLGELTDAGLVAVPDVSYELTERGRDVAEQLRALAQPARHAQVGQMARPRPAPRERQRPRPRPVSS